MGHYDILERVGLLGTWVRAWGLFSFVVLLVATPAWVAHELAHYVAARWAQLHPVLRLDPFPAVEYDYPAPRYVRYAPTIHGTLIGITYLATRGVPELDVLGALGLLWWVVYTYPSESDRNPLPLEDYLSGGSGGDI